MKTTSNQMVGDEAKGSTLTLSATERLAFSRSKLVRHMSGDVRNIEDGLAGEEEIDVTLANGAKRLSTAVGTWGLLKLAVNSWWRHHPANMAVLVATPLFHRYADRKPFQLLAFAAGLGAAAVLLKPWRLISLGGLALATLKSSEFSGLVASLLSAKGNEMETTDNRQDIPDLKKEIR